MSDIPTPQFSFLPSPRIPFDGYPSMPDPAWCDELHPGGGDFIRTIHGIHTGVVGSINALEAGRPRGRDWVAAMRADSDALTAGKPPREFAVARLLDGDNARWAAASAQARSMVARIRLARDTAPRSELAAAATSVWRALGDPLGIASENAYRNAAAGGDRRGAAWTAFDLATNLAADGARHSGLAHWVTGDDQVFDPLGWPAPWTRVSRGHYLTAGWLLDPTRHPVNWALEGVVWPAGAPDLRGEPARV